MRPSLALFWITSWLLACLALAPSAAAQQSTVTVPLTAQNGSGITGNATLTDLGNNQTRVQISITPATGDHPAHIHMGTCANLDPTPEFPLTNVQNGTSTTVVNQALSTIMRTQRAINLHLSAAEIATYVACGDIAGNVSCQCKASSATCGQYNVLARAGSKRSANVKLLSA